MPSFEQLAVGCQARDGGRAELDEEPIPRLP